MSASVNFASTPRIGIGRLGTGSTTPDAPTAAVAIFEGGSAGSRIHRIDINAVHSVTLNTVYLHMSVTGSGTYRLIASVAVAATPLAAGTPPFSGNLFYPEGLPVPQGYTLYASAHVASGTQSFDIVAHGGDF